jgi:hypothetical protein
MWQREHRLESGQPIRTRAYWNGAQFVSDVEGLPNVYFDGPSVDVAKEDADSAALRQYPHDCAVQGCADWVETTDR